MFSLDDYAQFAMTEADVNGIEAALGIRLPDSYRQAVLKPATELPPQMFTDPVTIIGTNLGYRRSSWLGRPLECTFFVFGRDDEGNALQLDLDIPGGFVLSADHARRRGRAEARSFEEWLSRCGKPVI